jgi:hypothetical protein
MILKQALDIQWQAGAVVGKEFGCACAANALRSDKRITIRCGSEGSHELNGGALDTARKISRMLLPAKYVTTLLPVAQCLGWSLRRRNRVPAFASTSYESSNVPFFSNRNDLDNRESLQQHFLAAPCL